MGVPRLGRFLEPFGKPVYFSSYPEVPLNCSLVIDGPSFAFWLWFSQGIVCSDFQGYQKAVLDFHHLLSRLRFKEIEYIFDGGLPFSKHQVRVNRYQQKINDLRSAYINLCVPIAQHVLMGLAKAKVIVCNEEADKYCAFQAKKLDAVILSQDSDFLLYDIDTPHYGYIPLQSLDVTSNGISGRKYRFDEIQKDFHFDLHILAAYLGVEGHPLDLVIDYHNTFEHICKILENSVKDKFIEKLVSKEELTRVHAFYSLNDLKLETSTINTFMWGRVQELLNSQLQPAEIWLPQLLELPSKHCSWLESAPLRLQAYANFSKQMPEFGTEVLEYFRLSDRLSKRLISVDYDYATVCETLDSKFSNWNLPHRLVLWTLRCMKNLNNITATSFLLMHVSLFLGSPMNLQPVEPTQEDIASVSRFIATIYSICMLIFSEDKEQSSISFQEFVSFSPLSSTLNFALFHQAASKLKTGKSPLSIVTDKTTASLTYKMYKDLTNDYSDIYMIMDIWKPKRKRKTKKDQS
ncbi:nuclease, XP-G family protein Ast1 [Schizosaccharomyces pombe]|uniref:Asteroid homolog 1 n=1 Tax=Schizosaccharomyces pombe (strain 972 / ATCC 24843) TaxID=284812 RepID=AST1_SCHPO|nr:XP-G family protein ast1 [Schizosaccharomyces pombe]O14061.3 RecName: Full=Asteroid homolog 1 [Schizosaccharomyces pombe 972h-]CAA20437.2 asteroid homolog, XP-G family protein [Schizosaccharomyces pombe]|eukprot:NP_587870.2 XP-G family protein ast1 [Schizosaccharomyces pombe]